MRVSCTECSVVVAKSYLKAHMARIHEICIIQTRGVDEVGGRKTTYVVSFPRALQTVKFSVLGCLEVSHGVGRLQEHFVYRQFWSKVEVYQEWVELLPHCGLFIMHMPAGRLVKHQRTAQCDKNTQMWCRRRDVEIADKFLEATFSLTGEDGL